MAIFFLGGKSRLTLRDPRRDDSGFVPSFSGAVETTFERASRIAETTCSRRRAPMPLPRDQSCRCRAINEVLADPRGVCQRAEESVSVRSMRQVWELWVVGEEYPEPFRATTLQPRGTGPRGGGRSAGEHRWAHGVSMAVQPTISAIAAREEDGDAAADMGRAGAEGGPAISPTTPTPREINRGQRGPDELSRRGTSAMSPRQTQARRARQRRLAHRRASAPDRLAPARPP